MKHVICNNDGFRYLFEINDLRHPKNHKHLKFTTEWDKARRDGSEQAQFEIILSAEQVENLKRLL